MTQQSHSWAYPRRKPWLVFSYFPILCWNSQCVPLFFSWACWLFLWPFLWTLHQVNYWAGQKVQAFPQDGREEPRWIFGQPNTSLHFIGVILFFHLEYIALWSHFVCVSLLVSMKLDCRSLEACPCVDTSLRGRHVASGSGGSVGAEASMGQGFSWGARVLPLWQVQTRAGGLMPSPGLIHLVQTSAHKSEAFSLCLFLSVGFLKNYLKCIIKISFSLVASL